ncbi:hypothetical protein PTI98_002210 [Pleurotus ostreatus]|nr:hypothetical protein PTI98_002210 [Pleurotus ostreatus]
MKLAPTPKMPLNFLFVLVAIAYGAAVVEVVSATNDWSRPCFDGECAYDLPSHGDSALGAFKIKGSPKAITDITPAAGWIILDCDPHALSQEIRLVCQSDDKASDESCSHVFDHWGAVDKIVRLPDGCGAGPFARISQAWVAHDQTLPGHVEGRVVRRDGIPPVIHSFKVDTNFDEVDSSKVGDINFAFVGLTSPSPSRDFPSDIDLNFEFVDSWFDDTLKSVGGWTSGAFHTAANGVVQAVAGVGKAVGLAGQAVGTAATDTVHAVGTAGQAVGHAATDVGKAVGQAGQAIGQAAETAGKAVAGAADTAFKAVESVPGLLQSASTFRYESPAASQTFEFNGNKTIINYQDTKCPKSGGTVRAGVIMDGSLIPAKVKEFAAFAGLTFDVDASIVLKAAVLGGYDSKRIKLISPVGLPFLTIPGILTVGPMVHLEAEVKALLAMEIDTDVHLKYNVENLELWYPKAKKQTVGKGMHTTDAPLKLKANAQANAKGYIEGHLVPSLKIGISALKDSINTDVYLEADAFARVSIAAEAHASGTVSAGGAAPAKAANGNAVAPARDSPAKAAVPVKTSHSKTAAAAPKVAAPHAGHKGTTKGKGKRHLYVPPYAHSARRRGISIQDDGAASFSGCVELSAGLQLNFGVQAKAGAVLDLNESGSLWTSPIWPIWSSCFEAGAKVANPASSLAWNGDLEQKFKANDLKCDASGGGALKSIPATVVGAKKWTGTPTTPGLEKGPDSDNDPVFACGFGLYRRDYYRSQILDPEEDIRVTRGYSIYIADAYWPGRSGMFARALKVDIIAAPTLTATASEIMKG